MGGGGGGGAAYSYIRLTDFFGKPLFLLYVFDDACGRIGLMAPHERRNKVEAAVPQVSRHGGQVGHLAQHAERLYGTFYIDVQGVDVQGVRHPWSHYTYT
jgi:hypothetical protein